MRLRRRVTLAMTLILAFGLFAGVAGADNGLPEHGHIKLIGAEWTGSGAGGDLVIDSYRRCVDLPVTPLQAHHSSIHQGQAAAGLATGNPGQGTHLVLPVAPFPGIPFEDCASFEAFVENVFDFPNNPIDLSR